MLTSIVNMHEVTQGLREEKERGGKRNRKDDKRKGERAGKREEKKEKDTCKRKGEITGEKVTTSLQSIYM